ncbi:MAG: exodeoxyribonuclease VII large subunit [Chloroflexota bacterium]
MNGGRNKPGTAARLFTVSEITRYLKDLFDTDDLLADIWVAGEISNLSQALSGHLYFTLKDAACQLQCVLFRQQAQRQSMVPQNGMALLAHGRITVYEPQGRYQLYVDLLLPQGLGELHLLFEALKQRLWKEGLFAPEHKRALPRFPEQIGVVTSPVGAVLWDILNVLSRRYPLARVIVAPTLVQGEEAPPQIVEAINALNDRTAVDVIIVARGGGSLEELWAFNDERVARAIYSSKRPVVTGIGHEADLTIADLVADVRAPTPSAAAELVAPDLQEHRRQVQAWRWCLAQALGSQVAAWRQRLVRELRALRSNAPNVDRRRQEVDELLRRATAHLRWILQDRQARLAGLGARLKDLNPFATLERGYAIVWQREARRLVTTVRQVAAGDALSVQVSDGEFGARVE